MSFNIPEIIHGRPCVKRGNRWFAIEKVKALADMLAAESASFVRPNHYVRAVLSQAGRARVVSNIKHR